MNEEQIKNVNAFLIELVEIREELKENPSASLRAKYKLKQEECVNRLEFLVDCRTNRYKKFSNYEDLYQEGRCALLMAMTSYNPKKGDFIWWANKYIKTKISREANKHSTIKIPLKKASKEQPYKVSSLPVMIDSSSNAMEIIEKKELTDSVHSAINKLPLDQQEIIKMHFDIFDESSAKPIGKICDKLKISRPIAVKLLKDAKTNLEMELAEAI